MPIAMNEFDHRFLALRKQQRERPEGGRGDSNLNLCDPSAVLNQLSYPADWERVVMWVDYKRVDVEIDDNNTAWFSLGQ